MLARPTSSCATLGRGIVGLAVVLSCLDAAAQAPLVADATEPAAAVSTDVSADAVPVASAEAEVPTPMRHAPRLYELGITGSNSVRTELPLDGSTDSHHPFGIGARLRIGWRVGGLSGGSRSWVGFETAFVGQPSATFRDSEVLTYGIFVKHAFRPRAHVHPYLAYGLGAAQVWVHHVPGRAIGHQTRLGFGVDVDVRSGTTVGVGLDYVMVVMPTFGTSTSAARVDGFDHLTLVLTVGFESGLSHPR